MSDALRIIFAGSGEFGSPTLRLLVVEGFKIVRVYTQPDRPAGRGKKLTGTPIAQLGEELGLGVTRTADINQEALEAADVLVVIAFGQKIGQRAVSHARLGSVNLHASRLPLYRGAAPINWAIIRGERVTGNSVIRLAEKMDSGAILGQTELQIGEMETAGELHDRLAVDGAGLIRRVLAELSDGTAIEVQQEHGRATLAPKLSRESAVIDWQWPAARIARTINGLSPWPGCRVQLLDQSGAVVGRLTLARAKEVNGENSGVTEGHLTERGFIQAGDGRAVEMHEVQPEGKRAMSLADYRRGNRWTMGLRVESI